MSITVNYLPLRAKSENVKLILEYGNIPWISNDVTFADWPALKTSGELCHFGQLPSITLPTGTVISQSGAIARYAARLAGIFPDDPLKAAEADMIFELTQDMNAINPVYVFYDKDSEIFQQKSAEYFAALPAWLEAVSKILGSKSFFGDETPHHGDFALFHILNISLPITPTCLDEYPSIKEWYGRVEALPSVAKYLSERPGPGSAGFGKPGSFIMST